MCKRSINPRPEKKKRIKQKRRRESKPVSGIKRKWRLSAAGMFFRQKKKMSGKEGEKGCPSGNVIGKPKISKNERGTSFCCPNSPKKGDTVTEKMKGRVMNQREKRKFVRSGDRSAMVRDMGSGTKVSTRG